MFLWRMAEAEVVSFAPSVDVSSTTQSQAELSTTVHSAYLPETITTQLYGVGNQAYTY